MRVAAVALVLIVGAAVVLWFGNTLNSWVLGGLIGGLAALLLSIPISLTLFSYLSRRQDERLRAEALEEASLAQTYEYEYLEEPVEVEAEAYMLPPEREWSEQENNRRLPPAHNLPVPTYPRYPVARKNPAPASDNLAYRQRSMAYPPVPEQPPGRGKGTPAQRPSPNRRMTYPGFPGYQPSSARGQHQTAALRAARQEMVRQYDDEEVLPTPTSKRLPVPRRESDLMERQQFAHPGVPRASRQLPPQAPNQYRPGRTVEGSAARPGARRPLPAGGESTANRPAQGSSPRIREPRTDELRDRYPKTGPVRQQPQTGQMARNPQLNEQRRHPDIITGSLKHPLVRRAPYMYEDDAIREELAQQLDFPKVRRSSREEQ